MLVGKFTKFSRRARSAGSSEGSCRPSEDALARPTTGPAESSMKADKVRNHLFFIMAFHSLFAPLYAFPSVFFLFADLHLLIQLFQVMVQIYPRVESLPAEQENGIPCNQPQLGRSMRHSI